MKISKFAANLAVATLSVGLIPQGSVFHLVGDDASPMARFLPNVAFDKPNEGGAPNTKSVEDLAQEVKAAMETSIDKVKELAEEALGKSNAGEKVSAELKEKSDESLSEMNLLKGRFDEMEQLMARSGTDDVVEVKSFGEQFTETDAFKTVDSKGLQRNERLRLDVKADITSATADAPGSMGPATDSTRIPGMLELPKRRMTVRDLLTQAQTSNPSVEYVRQTGFVNNAAGVAETSKKPQSDIQSELVSESTKVIAHFMKASKQILSDVPGLSSFINNQLLYGLEFVEEAQILSGDGTAQNLNGIIPQATAFAAAFTVAAETPIDKMRLAMLQAVLAEYPATGHVMNPIDWARVETAKDGDGRYIIGNPQGSINSTLWNLPVVTTQAMEVDKFLTGAFKMGATLYDQWTSSVEAGYENDDFTKNMLTILAEERLLLAVMRPEAFIYGDLGYVV